MIIKYWSDYACPFCYIAAARMKRALKEMGLENECRLDFKAFRLNPNAKKVPRRCVLESYAANYGMTIQQAQMQIDRINAMGASEGLDFHYDTALNSNTLDALRLTKLAQSKGRSFGDRFIDRFYRAYFSDNLILADHEVLRRLSKEVGLTDEEIASMEATPRGAALARLCRAMAPHYRQQGYAYTPVQDAVAAVSQQPKK